ncbi:Coronin-2B [Boothiomyces sp. JEL0866]|nr:Coronin-2B [Boothiomyces sp. JEL0866]
MASRFVRDRHTFGTPNKKENCFDNLKVTRSAWDTNLVSANPLFVAVNLEAGGGGAFTVLAHSQTGKLPDNLPVYNGHTAAVLDTDFNPFNDYIIASASEDCKAMIWKIPDGGLTESISTPVLTLAGHQRKVGHVLFNPVADNILATTSADFLVKIWDISTGQEKFELNGHTEIINSISWSWEGNLLFSACKDKKLRIWDVRSGKIVQEAAGHQGVKGSRVVAMGNSSYITTTGFSRSSDRQVYVWDYKNLSQPIKQENIDTASGLLIPYFDSDTNMLYLAGKGDGNIRYYEWVEEEKNLYILSEYKSSDPLRGICFLPKRACAINEVEVAKIFKVHPTMVEPISFKVPRKSDLFQSDLFPDTIGPNPSLTAAEWLSGKTAGPKLISLESGFVPPAPKEFVTTGAATVTPVGTAPPPLNEKEFQEQYQVLKKENEELKSVITQRDIRIRQLEAQLASMSTQ